MNDLKKIAPLLRHPHKEQRRMAIQALGKIKQEATLKVLVWFIKNDGDAELKSLALETAKKLKLELSSPAPEEAGFVLDESLFDEPLAPQAFQTASFSDVDFELDESLFAEPIAPQTVQTVNLPKSDLDAKTRRVQADYPVARYDLIDTAFGLLFAMAFLLSLSFTTWFDLRTLREESGRSTSRDLLLDQSELESSGFANTLTTIPVFCYMILMLMGAGLVSLYLPLGGFLRVLRNIVHRIPPRIYYGIALVLVLGIFLSTWIWYSVYASSLVLDVLETRNIEVQAFNLIRVTSLSFWIYLAYLMVLIGACVIGINRHHPQNAGKLLTWDRLAVKK